MEFYKSISVINQKKERVYPLFNHMVSLINRIQKKLKNSKFIKKFKKIEFISCISLNTNLKCK